MYAHKLCGIIRVPTFCTHMFKQFLNNNVTKAPVFIDCVHKSVANLRCLKF